MRESDRYRGRRRAPTPARGRYAAVLTTAFVGAGIVAFGAGAGIKDAKVDALVADTSVAEASSSQRDYAAGAPNRSVDRNVASSISSAPEDVWLLPLRGYRLTSPFGQRWGRLHAGIDLGGIRAGTPIYAVKDGTVILCRANGGYGLNVQIDHGGGLVTVYGHASKLFCKEGQQVKAGELIAAVGNTGHSFGDHLHLEIHVNGSPVNPIPFFKERGVDFYLETEAVYGVNG
ncbi:M23 family metallopeptidase [Catelliglobosispora koreensis]|uniref:M23 family metallopeptidase n=1 Tax=Catelliglobosispora koreensis TaxID=129052 RepID=UPI00035FDE0F|nr:M23 family metallopeptidase [Catelliglobosispora koreensis]